MKSETGSFDFTLAVDFAASPETSFDALLDPKQQREWWGGAGDIVRASCDLRVGGRATIEWGPSEAALIRSDQVFREIERPRRVVYTEVVTQSGFASYECLLVFALAPAGSGTRLTLHHSGFPTPEDRDLHEGGTRIGLGRLAAYLARPSASL